MGIIKVVGKTIGFTGKVAVGTVKTAIFGLQILSDGGDKLTQLAVKPLDVKWLNNRLAKANKNNMFNRKEG